MENKCNKAPNTSIKYMDHVYCQANEGKSYIRANHGSSGTGNSGVSNNSDFLALLKENKQLKAMLILHLDLIQEQSDQLIAKDKQLSGQKEHIDALRAKTSQLESQVQELQKQLQRQIKRVVSAVGEISSLPPPPLAKIQTKVDHSAVANIIGECNGKIISKILLHRVNQPVKREKTKSPSENVKEGSSEPEPITKLSSVGTVKESDLREDKQNKKDSNIDAELVETKPDIKEELIPPLIIDDKVKEVVTQNISSSPANICATPPTPSRGKQMPLMLWHASPIHSEESVSGESILDDDDDEGGDLSHEHEDDEEEEYENHDDDDQDGEDSDDDEDDDGEEEDEEEYNDDHCSSIAESLNPDKSTDEFKDSQSEADQLAHEKSRHSSYISTNVLYCTREWEDEEAICEYEFTKEEADALHADAPMLEIPKWTEHELSALQCSDGVEDLSDETFLKRHAKLEVDERRRKKWDVQQIREQRRIEKLKRRHCKEEVSSTSDNLSMISFYPPAEGIETICYVNELPVQAFGEMVPKLSAVTDFVLPWETANTTDDDPAVLPNSLPASTESPSSQSPTPAGIGNESTASPHESDELCSSTFVLIKKRKRQQSGSATVGPGPVKQKICNSTKSLPATAINNLSPQPASPNTEDTSK